AAEGVAREAHRRLRRADVEVRDAAAGAGDELLEGREQVVRHRALEAPVRRRPRRRTGLAGGVAREPRAPAALPVVARERLQHDAGARAAAGAAVADAVRGHLEERLPVRGRVPGIERGRAVEAREGEDVRGAELRAELGGRDVEADVGRDDRVGVPRLVEARQLARRVALLADEAVDGVAVVAAVDDLVRLEALALVREHRGGAIALLLERGDGALHEEAHAALLEARHPAVDPRL